MKKNFLLDNKQYEVFKELSDEDAGKLIKGIYKYVDNGDSELDGYLKLLFIPIKQVIDANEDSYKKRCERNKVNGSKGGAPKGNQNAKKDKNNRKQPKTTENNMLRHNHIHNHNHIQDYNNSIIKIIDYLNTKSNSKYKASTKSTAIKITARLNEGYKLDDFIDVIDKKCNEWIGTEYEKFLCPETLFGNKFEKYLNQKINCTLKNENKPDWFDKQIDQDIASDQEIALLEKRIGGI